MSKKEVNLEVIAKSNNLDLFVLYTYDLKKQSKSTAVRFVYLLKGRNKDQGIIQEFKGKFLAPGCFTIPIKKDAEMQDIFTYWKIPFKKIKMLTH